MKKKKEEELDDNLKELAEEIEKLEKEKANNSESEVKDKETIKAINRYIG